MYICTLNFDTADKLQSELRKHRFHVTMQQGFVEVDPECEAFELCTSKRALAWLFQNMGDFWYRSNISLIGEFSFLMM